MPVQLLNWQAIPLNPNAGSVSLFINGNIDTTISARAWWFRDDAKVADRTMLLNAGQPFVLTLDEIKGGKERRLMFRFIAGQGNPPERHLFVRVLLRQVSPIPPLLTRDYEEDLPAGHNNWTLTDGVRLA